MELKYYLRGLGLGIVLTAIVMGVATSRHRTMTNEEIIARARQLGMTEDTTLTNINSEKTDSEGASFDDAAAGEVNKETGSEGLQDKLPDTALDAAGTENVDNAQAAASDKEGGAKDGDSVKDNDSVKAEDGAKDSGEDAKTVAKMTDTGTDVETGDQAESGKTADDSGVTDTPKVITIGHGDGSYTVSKKLADIDAVSAADSFDTFLCQNGYDKKIRAGTYTIPYNASDEQIARIITGVE